MTLLSRCDLWCSLTEIGCWRAMEPACKKQKHDNVVEEPAKPIKEQLLRFIEYMDCREKVRLRRLAKLHPGSWTSDFPTWLKPLLDRYKFCNVKRKYDAVTKVFLDKIPGDATIQEVIGNSAVHRMFTNRDFSNALPWFRIYEEEKILDIAKQTRDKTGHAFGDAHTQCRLGRNAEANPGKDEEKNYLEKARIAEQIFSNSELTQIDTWENLCKTLAKHHRHGGVKGIGVFLAMEVYIGLKC